MIDPRLTPARGDVAAAHLKGQVEAKRFVEGIAYQMKDGVSALRETPSLSARLETQVLRGEIFTVYEERDGWAFGQCALDDYVGYVEARALSREIVTPTHRLSPLHTLTFPEPSLKAQPHQSLSCNAKVAIQEQRDGFARLDCGRWAPAHHFVTLDHRVPDYVVSAQRLLGAPYLWGGKDAFGVDCSGLVQSALETAGIACPRDSDMQETALGSAIDPDGPKQRGDLVFWDGHVGIMLNGALLLHANGFHMETVIEDLSDTIARVGAPRTVRRL